MNAAVADDVPGLLKLDLCCGIHKKEGFLGVDRRKFPGVDVITDLRTPWPWSDGSAQEIHMSHALEHFSGVQRVHIFNEMYRVLVPQGKATIITPHWSSNRAYCDFTHLWPPVSEMLYFYVSKKWRQDNAPDNDIEWNPRGYSCDFDATWGYGVRPDLLVRNQEYQMFALSNYKEAATDMIATLVARK